MSSAAVKEALFDHFARVGKALSSGRRAEIVDLLGNGERSVEALAQEIRQTVANTSQHLQVLRNAGLIRSRRDGNFVYYRLASPEVIRFWRSLQKIARDTSSDAENLVRDYLGDNDVEEITMAELRKRLERKDRFVLLDVRPVEEYEAGHIPGAVSIPLSELRNRIDELPQNSEIVAYCRGPVCALAPQAARYLTREGFKVSRLADGAPDWRAAGLPLEEG